MSLTFKFASLVCDKIPLYGNLLATSYLPSSLHVLYKNNYVVVYIARYMIIHLASCIKCKHEHEEYAIHNHTGTVSYSYIAIEHGIINS